MNKSPYYKSTPVTSRRAHPSSVPGLGYSAGKQNKDLQWTSHVMPSLLYV